MNKYATVYEAMLAYGACGDWLKWAERRRGRSSKDCWEELPPLWRSGTGPLCRSAGYLWLRQRISEHWCMCPACAPWYIQAVRKSDYAWHLVEPLVLHLVGTWTPAKTEAECLRRAEEWRSGGVEEVLL